MFWFPNICLSIMLRRGSPLVTTATRDTGNHSSELHINHSETITPSLVLLLGLQGSTQTVQNDADRLCRVEPVNMIPHHFRLHIVLQSLSGVCVAQVEKSLGQTMVRESDDEGVRESGGQRHERRKETERRGGNHKE